MVKPMLNPDFLNRVQLIQDVWSKTVHAKPDIRNSVPDISLVKYAGTVCGI